MQYALSRGFEKQFAKLPKKTKEKAIVALKLFIENPEHSSLRNHSLRGEWLGFRGINITGDIRALYVLHDTGMAQFVAIGSHAQLYG
jgi:addiction module RelE/StbE family toxin